MLYYGQEVKAQEENGMASRKAEYDIRYAKENLKRVPVNFQRSEFESFIKPAIDKSGLSVGAFIKAAIAEKIERDGLDNKA